MVEAVWRDLLFLTHSAPDCALVGDIPKRPVQACPALGLDLLLETGPDHLLASS
jgi:hypothetical protein